MTFEPDSLVAHGINLHAVFDLDALPDDIQAALRGCCDDLSRYRQLILFGHGGRQLWQSVAPLIAAGESADPIDTYSQQQVAAWWAARYPGLPYRVLYPGDAPVPLQRLGALAGWHHGSPFRVGINAQWGSWFAYRVLMLVDSAFAPTPKMVGDPPCASCVSRPCVSACPAQAMAGDGFAFEACVQYRLQPDSACRDRCLARQACPVGIEHRYDEAQLQYHYLRSLRSIEQFYSTRQRES